MKVTIELTTDEEIKAFYKKMLTPADKPGTAAQKEPDPVPQPQQPAPGDTPAQKDAPKEPDPAPQPEPAAVSFPEIQKMCIRRIDEGKRGQLQELLQKYSVVTILDLKDKPELLARFAKDLEVI